jgi:hypothetical protein
MLVTTTEAKLTSVGPIHARSCGPSTKDRKDKGISTMLTKDGNA